MHARRRIKNIYRTLLAKAISESQDTIHDAHRPEVRECFPETRKTALKHMTEWIFTGPPCILWLSGPAGVGKSAIARILCKELQGNGIIGGDFFFSRSGSQKAKHLFPTLAYELAAEVPCIGKMIGDKIAANPFIRQRHGSPAFLAPLQHFVDPHDPPVVFFIDECEDDKVQCKIIQVVQGAFNDKSPLPYPFV